jgi:hypothetical protein
LLGGSIETIQKIRSHFCLSRRLFRQNGQDFALHVRPQFFERFAVARPDAFFSGT